MAIFIVNIVLHPFFKAMQQANNVCVWCRDHLPHSCIASGFHVKFSKENVSNHTKQNAFLRYFVVVKLLIPLLRTKKTQTKKEKFTTW
jgi:Zn ribbon nucleic-acid-binding protein